MVAAKYYLYINKLAHKDLSLDEFMAKINWQKTPSFNYSYSKNQTYQNNLLINLCNPIVWIITTAVLFFFVFM